MAIAVATPAPVAEARLHARLTSLDAVRGLAVAGMVLVENLPGPIESFRWLRHDSWHGLTVADVVFPLFLVVMGAGMAQWLRPPVTSRTLRRLVIRSLALIAIGVLVFGWWGEGGGLDSLRIPGVLQRIGVAGLLAGVVIVGLRRWWAVAVFIVALLVGYGWLLEVPTIDGCRGADIPECTAVGQVDLAVFSADHVYRDGTAGYDPEGLASTAGAVASVLIGWLAGELLRSGRVVRMAALGAGCLAGGLLCSDALDVNKRLWTPSFTLVTAAISIGLMWIATRPSTVPVPAIVWRSHSSRSAGMHFSCMSASTWSECGCHAPHRRRHRLDVARRSHWCAVGRPTGCLRHVRNGHADRLDASRLRAPRPAVVRDAVKASRFLRRGAVGVGASCCRLLER